MAEPNITSSGSPNVTSSESVGGAGIRDSATGQDELGFEPYVKALSAFLTHQDTKPPLTVSVEGPWGSGKSSLMLQLMNDVSQRPLQNGKPPRTVWFNAWRLDKEEALWAAFALSVTQTLARALPLPERIWVHAKLQAQRFDWRKGWFGVTRFLVLLFFLIYTRVAVGRYIWTHRGSLYPVSSISAAQSKDATEKGDEALLRLLLTALGSLGYLLLAAMLVKKATDIVGNPFQVDLKRYSTDLNYEERVAFIQRFHEDFSQIVRSYARGQTVFIFIDDLDRCEIPKAADLMQAINLLLSDSSQIVYVLGLDREKIAAGLAAKFSQVLPFLNEKRDGSTGYSGLDFGYSYLEKFIQIPFQVPKPAARDIDRLLAALNQEAPGTMPTSSSEVSPGVLFETRADSPLVKSIVKDMAIALEYNPRRIKQFINHFRLSAIIASQTGLFDLVEGSSLSALTPQVLGKLLTITLRWPLLIVDASNHPDLLQNLETMALAPIAPSNDLERFWISKTGVKELLSVGRQRLDLGATGMNPSYSLVGLDLERYLQVSPAITRRRDVAPGESQAAASQESVNPDESYSSSSSSAQGRGGRPISPPSEESRLK